MCIYCGGTGVVTGYELSRQYGTTTLTVAKCLKCDKARFKDRT